MINDLLFSKPIDGIALMTELRGKPRAIAGFLAFTSIKR
jgi:hypothetical protein